MLSVRRGKSQLFLKLGSNICVYTQPVAFVVVVVRNVVVDVVLVDVVVVGTVVVGTVVVDVWA